MERISLSLKMYEGSHDIISVSDFWTRIFDVHALITALSYEIKGIDLSFLASRSKSFINLLVITRVQ
jgi:hypothetical protein